MRTLVIAILGLFLVISAGADSLLYRILGYRTWELRSIDRLSIL